MGARTAFPLWVDDGMVVVVIYSVVIGFFSLYASSMSLYNHGSDMTAAKKKKKTELCLCFLHFTVVGFIMHLLCMCVCVCMCEHRSMTLYRKVCVSVELYAAALYSTH